MTINSCQLKANSYWLLNVEMQDFRNVKVWEKAHNLTLLVYQLTMNFPREELFGLRTQLRKTCVEIPAYIAEGCGIRPLSAHCFEFCQSV